MAAFFHAAMHSRRLLRVLVVRKRPGGSSDGAPRVLGAGRSSTQGGPRVGADYARVAAPTRSLN